MTSILRALFAVGTGALLQTGSCFTVTQNPPTDTGTPAATQIKVRFVNASAAALDPEFFATATATSDPAALFVPASQITAGIGVGGRGILQAAGDDSIDVDCANAATIGTKGGTFLDGEGNALGHGTQRILSLGSAFSCGETITFTYQGAGGAFSTGYVVQ
jgi:hypothetical protein